MININLIPPEYIEREKKKAAVILIGAVAAIALTTIGSFSFYKIRHLGELNKKIGELNTKVKTLEETAKKVDDLEAKKKDIDARNSLVNQLLQGRFNYPMLMEAIALSVPVNQAAISGLTMQPIVGTGAFNLNIQAQATGTEALLKWLKKLEATPDFSKISLGSIGYTPDGVSFPITCAYTLPQ